jgi:sulfite reductase (ferredoxin)
MLDAYYFCVGGSVGEFAAIARPVGYRCLATEVPDAIERLLRGFQAERNPGENLRRFFARHSDTEIRELLAGAAVDAVERDASPGRVPRGVEV